jgi:hypothetical protein
MTASENRQLTAEELLASPRGRAFVDGVVTRGFFEGCGHYDEVGRPLTDQALALDNLVLTPDRAAEIAHHLSGIPLITPTQDGLEHSLIEVIGAAVYWQRPDDWELALATQEVRQALVPFAEAIIATGLLDDWSRPVDPDSQWALAWDDSEHKGMLPAVYFVDPESPAALAEVSRDDMVAPFDPSSGVVMPQNLKDWLAWMLTAETDYRHDFAKDPFEEVGGEWWSTPPNALWTSTDCWPKGTPIGVDLVEDDFGLERARACRLKIRTGARICEIHTPDDWADLCRRYPLEVTAQRRQVWFETTGRKGRWVIPDWSRVAEDFDGVHVSLAGYLRTAGAVVDVGDASFIEDSPSRPTAGDTDERTASLMAGWNPDTTYWLGDVVTGIAEVAEWVYDDDADAWRQVLPF